MGDGEENVICLWVVGGFQSLLWSGLGVREALRRKGAVMKGMLDLRAFSLAHLPKIALVYHTHQNMKTLRRKGGIT